LTPASALGRAAPSLYSVMNTSGKYLARDAKILAHCSGVLREITLGWSKAFFVGGCDFWGCSIR